VLPHERGPLTDRRPPLINVFQPSLGREELAALAGVFESNWIGKGALTEQFEAAFANYLAVDRPLVRSINCCTEGLFQAMPLLGIGPGDEVILPSISFVGAANAVAAAGATPVFCDVDPRTLNASAETVGAKMTPRTKAVLILHYGGVPCEMDALTALAHSRRVALIEDSACSVASTYKNRFCGTFGDIGLWSFDALKLLSTGDGGMIYCRDAGMAQRAERLFYLGLTHPTGFSSEARERWWEFDVTSPARRAITNDIASAIGLEQLKKLPSFLEKRKEVHAFYDDALAGLDWLQTPPPLPAGMQSSYYMYWVQAPAGARDRLARCLKERGIYTTFRYFPLHRLAVYGTRDRLPHAEQAADTTLCLPIHQRLSDEDLQRVAGAIREFGRRL
jgi:dTDP-4-amino-4,6-dideoxygalactose transaminase